MPWVIPALHCFTLHVGKAQADIGKHRLKSVEGKIAASGMYLKAIFPVLITSVNAREHTPMTNSGIL